MADFKPIWTGKDWELSVNDKDEFMIYDNQAENNIMIKFEDKQEFQQLLSVFSNELWQESTDFTKDK